MSVASYTVTFGEIKLDEVCLSYRLYQHAACPQARQALLLHGAGVGGELTWDMVVPHLTHWSSILVPDLRGMAKTYFHDGQEHAFEVQDVVVDLQTLLDQLAWQSCDLVGYSFGGLVASLLKQQQPQRFARLMLIEPALFDREDICAVRELRQRYADAAQLIRRSSSPEEGIRIFLDNISPHRNKSEHTEQMTIARLAERALGFANALDAVNRAAQQLDRTALFEALGPQVSLIAGGRSPAALHQHYAQLQQHFGWRYHQLKGTDHALPYQKPRQLAWLLNEDSHYFELHTQGGL